MIKFELKRLIFEWQQSHNTGLTYRQLAEQTDLSLSTIYLVANNKSKQIGVETIEKLCGFFDCEPGELIIRVLFE